MKSAAEKLTRQELEGRVVVGEFVDTERPELTDIYARLDERFEK
jgi:hypothetical protein